MVVLPHVLTSIMSCAFQFIWEIYSWADELKKLSGLGFFWHGSSRCLLCGLAFLDGWVSIRPVQVQVTRRDVSGWQHISQVPARKTQQALNRPSSGPGYSGTFASFPLFFSAFIILVVFCKHYWLAFWTEKLCIYRVFCLFCLSSGTTTIFWDHWTVLYACAQRGLATRMRTLNYCYLVQQSLSSTCWLLMEGWHPVTLNALLDSQEQRQARSHHNTE